MDWDKLNSSKRLRDSSTRPHSADRRLPSESDYDRVIFSSAFRRLQDKTQAFPLESHDFVRTRLTHSCEVASVGRDLGKSVARKLKDEGKAKNIDQDDFGALVATACVLHDIGNPPFGHSGEKSIGSWFKKQIANGQNLDDKQEKNDLIDYEGNANAFRIATRTQSIGEAFGLNLTVGTLACLLKYPCASNEKVKNSIKKSRSKWGYFKADKHAFDQVQEITGLNGKRHPLVFLMEAADDIVYSAVDIEDALKKKVFDFDLLVAWLREKLNSGPVPAGFVDNYLVKKHDDLKKSGICSSNDCKQLAYQYFRVFAVGWMAGSCVDAFIANYEKILEGKFDNELTQEMEYSGLCSALKELAKEHVYPNKETVLIEAKGKYAIHGLLDILYAEYNENQESRLIKNLLPNVFVNPNDNPGLSEDYNLFIRLADYIAGMTDTFAISLYRQLTGAGI